MINNDDYSLRIINHCDHTLGAQKTSNKWSMSFLVYKVAKSSQFSIVAMLDSASTQGTQTNDQYSL